MGNLSIFPKLQTDKEYAKIFQRKIILFKSTEMIKKIPISDLLIGIENREYKQ